MLNLSNLSYKELQTIAKAFGIKANQSHEELMIAIALVQGATQPEAKQEEVAVNEENFSSFDELFEEEEVVVEEVSIKSAKDLQTTGYVSNNLLEYAFNLYTRHRLDVNELNFKDYRFIKSEVERLSALPYPPSPAQWTTIEGLIKEIGELDDKFIVPQGIISGLTGGVDGNAGGFIQFLYEKRDALAQNAPLTEFQRDKIASWFNCPDIPWEDYNIQIKKSYPTPQNPSGWMLLNPDEFKEELTAKMTKAQASVFMGENQNKYHEWKATRVTKGQRDRIRKLEERLSTIGKLGVVSFAQNADGSVEQIYKKPVRDFTVGAYEPLSDWAMEQMDVNTASKHIEQLEKELAMKNRSSIDNSPAQDQIEKKRQQYKGSADRVTAIEKEKNATIDMIFALEMASGLTFEEMHEQITELFVEKSLKTTQFATILYDLFDYLLTKEYVAFKGLMDMAQHSEIACKVLEVYYPKQYNEAVGGKKSVEKQKQEAKKQADMSVEDFMKAMK